MKHRRGYSPIYKWMGLTLLTGFVFMGALPERTKAEAQPIIYPVIPFTGEYVPVQTKTSDSLIERIGRRVRLELCAAAREINESGRTYEAPASDRGGDLGAVDLDGEGNVLPSEDLFDDGEHIEVDQEDCGEEVNSLYSDAEPGYSEESVDYGEWVYYGNCRITHYDAGACCCGEWATGCTASGVLATTHHTVATGEDLPFGTELMINGEVYVVEDRGVEPYQVDVFVEDHQTALNMGMYYTDVYVRYQE